MIVLFVVAGLAIWLVTLAVVLAVWRSVSDTNRQLDELTEEEAEQMTAPHGNVHVLDDYREDRPFDQARS